MDKSMHGYVGWRGKGRRASLGAEKLPRKRVRLPSLVNYWEIDPFLVLSCPRGRVLPTIFRIGRSMIVFSVYRVSFFMLPFISILNVASVASHRFSSLRALLIKDNVARL